MKNFGEKEAWAYPGTAQIFRVPRIISGTVKATDFKFGQYVYSEGPSEQNPIKNFGEMGAWAYPGTAQFFRVPLLSHEQEKLRISNLASTFRGSIRTKAH